MSNDTITIPLSKTGYKYKGKYEAIVDSVDADLAEFNWNVVHKKYAHREVKIDGKCHKILLHRLILSRMLGRNLQSGEYVDHINGNGLDNRRKNLRLSNNAQNLSNRGKNSNNKSGYKGVHYHKPSGKWRAQIKSQDVRKSLGLFDTPEDAHKAYCVAADKYHGEFANAG